MIPSPDQWRPLLGLMRAWDTEPRPAHWTSHRDGTHTQSTDTMNTIADWIAASAHDEHDAA